MVLPQRPSENEVLRDVARLLDDRLPGAWALEQEPGVFPGSGRRPDALLRLRAPDGEEVRFVVEVKRTVPPRDLPFVRAQLQAYAEGFPWPIAPMLVARYLPPSTREWLDRENFNYADATGNIRITADQPALFLRDVGATTDPWRGPGRPRGTLVGEPPALVVRALVDYRPPVSVPQLVELSGASTGATYRVVKFLEEEALIRRPPRGPIEEVRWRQMLERWSKDYGFLRSNEVGSYLQPRGIQKLASDLADIKDIRYAVTGSLAAQKWAPYAPSKAAMVYTDDADELSRRLSLRQVDTGANVLLATAAFDVIFERRESFKGLTIVAPSQAVVDLLTGPGRNPTEAQALLDWMENNVQRWRRE